MGWVAILSTDFLPYVRIYYIFSTALHCTALHCTALHCTALHCTALHCTALHCTALNCNALQSTALHCTALHCTALHCTALHCTALHCTALHCTAHKMWYSERLQAKHFPSRTMAHLLRLQVTAVSCEDCTQVPCSILLSGLCQQKWR